MKMLSRAFAMMLASLTLAITLSVGVVSIYTPTSHATSETVVSVVQNQEVVLDEVIVASPVEESLKICKDEQGNAKACEDSDVAKHLLASMGGLKGASALVIAFVISKFLLLLLLSPMFTTIFPSLLKGSVKLTVATGLNLVVGVLSLMVPPVELPFSAAIVHSSVLALASVFANQAFKQYLTAKGKS